MPECASISFGGFRLYGGRVELRHLVHHVQMLTSSALAAPALGGNRT